MREPCEIPADYTWKINISSFDADRNRDLKPSSILKLQQEAGDRHLNAGGVTYSALFDRGMIFVLTRARMEIKRFPTYKETVTLTTWSRGIRGSQFFRCYRFEDPNSRPLINSMSAYALVDAENHRLLRPAVSDGLGIRHLPDREIACAEPPKVHVPDNAVFLAERPVRFTDIDYNGHVNNAVYADIVCDHMQSAAKNGETNRFPQQATGDQSMSRDRICAPNRISALTLHFLSEAREEDCLSLFMRESGEEILFKGCHARGDCFAAKVEWHKPFL